MAYLSSGSIKVYPSGYRDASVDLNASRTSEESITRAVRAPLSRRSFAKVDTDGSLTIVIGGYVFNIPNGISAIAAKFANPSEGDEVYASIDTTDAVADMVMLVNVEDESKDLDVGGEFKGMSFDLGSGDLLVLKYSNGAWDVPSESQLNVSSTQVSDGASGKSIAEELSTEKLTLSQLSNGSLFVDGSGNVKSLDCSYSYTRTSDSGNSVHVLDDIEISKEGQVQSMSETTLPLATSTHAGLVGTNVQTFSGNKTFQGNVTVGSRTSRSNMAVWGTPTFYSRAVLSEGLEVGNGNIEYVYREDQEGDTGLITKLDSDNNPVTKYNAQSATGLSGISHMYTEIKPYSLEIGYTYNVSRQGPARDVKSKLTPIRLEIDDTETCWSNYAYNVVGVSKYAIKSRYLADTNVGSEGKPVYINASGAPVAMTDTIGSSKIPVYMSNGTITNSTATVGSSVKHIYMLGGQFTESSASRGKKNIPVYMDGGEIKATNNAIDSQYTELPSVSSGSAWDAFTTYYIDSYGAHSQRYSGGWAVLGTIIGDVVTLSLTSPQAIAQVGQDRWMRVDLAKLTKALFSDSNLRSGKRKISSITITSNDLVATVSNIRTDMSLVGTSTKYVVCWQLENSVKYLCIGADEVANGNGFSVSVTFSADITWSD